MSFVEFIKNYWAQITILLGIVGFFGKLWLDRIIRIKEINYSNISSSIIETSKNTYTSLISYIDFLRSYHFHVCNKIDIDSTFFNELQKRTEKFNSNILQFRILLTNDKATFLEGIQSTVAQIDYQIETIRQELLLNNTSSELKNLIQETDIFFNSDFKTLKKELEDFIRKEIRLKRK